MIELMVRQLVITRDYEDSPYYLLFETGNMSKPLAMLTEFAAKQLLEELQTALAAKPAVRKLPKS